MSYSSASRVRVGVLLAITAVAVAALWLARSDSEPSAKPVVRRPIKCLPLDLPEPVPAPGTPERFYVVEELAKAALQSGRWDEADALGVELLDLAPRYPKNWNHGNAIHHGNLVRGQVALARGDVAQAKRRLLAAAATPGSPQLDSFGPNLVLAQQLLERGERAVVLQYIQLCKRFWEEDFGAAEEWTADIVGGRFPEFRGNLCY